MKHLTMLITSLALVAGSACKKDKKDEAGSTTSTEKTTEPTKEAPAKKASGRSIPNSNGLSVDAPAKWLDNGVGGAAGFHLDADGGMLVLNETSAEEQAKKLDAVKKETEEVIFEKWVSADETPDGFKMLWVIPKITMKGDEAVKDGTAFAFNVRRKIGSKVYDCSGSAQKQEDATEAMDLCTKIQGS
jgi:hypothetical protein